MRHARLKTKPRSTRTPAELGETQPYLTGARATQVAGASSLSTLMRLQPLVGNRATTALIQLWRDVNGKFYDGAKPDAANPTFSGWVTYEDEKKNVLWGPPGFKTLAEARSAVGKAQAAAVVPKPKKDYTAVFYEDPANLRFSQDSIDYTFQDGGNIKDLATQLKLGQVKATAIKPIRLTERKGNKITLDNRRLWAFKKAGVQIRCKWATAQQVKDEGFKFTGGNRGSASIAVRNAPADFENL